MWREDKAHKNLGGKMKTWIEFVFYVCAVITAIYALWCIGVDVRNHYIITDDIANRIEYGRMMSENHDLRLKLERCKCSNGGYR